MSSVYRYSCIAICAASAPHYASHLCHHCNNSISFHCKAVVIKSSIIACFYTFIYLILKHVLRGSIARLWEGCFTSLLCLFFSLAEATIFLAVESRHLFFWTVRYELEDELSGVILPSRLLTSDVMSLECERKLRTLNSHFICCPSDITKHNANCIFLCEQNCLSSLTDCWSNIDSRKVVENLSHGSVPVISQLSISEVLSFASRWHCSSCGECRLQDNSLLVTWCDAINISDVYLHTADRMCVWKTICNVIATEVTGDC